jgi:hypothetical protein
MRRIGVALLVVGIASCGGPKKVSFPVDDAKVLSTVSAADLQAMCESVIVYAKDAFDMACLAKGIAAKLKAGGTDQACQTAIAACQAELQSKPLSCKLADPKQLEGCTATVAEYETCINDALAMLYKLQGRLSCSLSAADVASLAAEMQSLQSLPPSCQSFAQKCPKVM